MPEHNVGGLQNQRWEAVFTQLLHQQMRGAPQKNHVFGRRSIQEKPMGGLEEKTNVLYALRHRYFWSFPEFSKTLNKIIMIEILSSTHFTHRLK